MSNNVIIIIIVVIFSLSFVIISVDVYVGDIGWFMRQHYLFISSLVVSDNIQYEAHDDYDAAAADDDDNDDDENDDACHDV